MNYISLLERTFLPRVFDVCFLYLFCLCFSCGLECSAAKWYILFQDYLGIGHLLFGDILPLRDVWS